MTVIAGMYAWWQQARTKTQEQHEPQSQSTVPEGVTA
jgi:hypothetical protein